MLVRLCWLGVLPCPAQRQFLIKLTNEVCDFVAVLFVATLLQISSRCASDFIRVPRQNHSPRDVLGFVVGTLFARTVQEWRLPEMRQLRHVGA